MVSLYKKGKILKLLENKYGADYGIVMSSLVSEENETLYEIAIYVGKVENYPSFRGNTFVPVLQRFKESELKKITGEEAEKLRIKLEEYDELYFTKPLIHESGI